MRRKFLEPWRNHLPSRWVLLMLLPILAVALLLVEVGTMQVASKSDDGSALMLKDSREKPDRRSARGMIEVIPARYEKRYSRWKSEYLSTKSGRTQWEKYSRDTGFLLIVTVSRELGRGARAGNYQWDGSGRLVSATITLGSEIDKGFPTNDNYPITCSLAPSNLSSSLGTEILAAAKLAHEFGHVNNTLTRDPASYETQNHLIIEYQKIFKANGFDVEDPKLLNITRRLGGSPTEIIRVREHEAERNVLAYIREKFTKGDAVNSMPPPLRQAIETYNKLQLK